MARQERIGSQSESIVSGGLAGLLAGSVFGGPIGAGIGLGVGLLSERLRKSELDRLAEDYASVQAYGSSIQQQVADTIPYADQFGDPSGSDHKQLDSIAAEAQRAQELAQSADPELRAAGVQSMLNTSAKFSAWHSELEARTQDQADAQLEYQAKVGEHYQSLIEKGQEEARAANAQADLAQTLVKNDPEIKNVETKTALMDMLGISPKEADQDAGNASFNLFGMVSASKQFDDFQPSYDQAVKMIEAFRNTKLKSMVDFVGQTVALAQQNGYGVEPDKDGKFNVKNLNTYIQQFRGVQPTNYSPPPGAPSVPTAIPGQTAAPGQPAGPTKPESEISQLVGGALESAGNAASSAGTSAKTALDSLNETVSKQWENDKRWLNQNLRRNRRRTN